MRTKLIVFSLCAFAANLLSAQDAPPAIETAVPSDSVSQSDQKASKRVLKYDVEKVYRHELGIDATPFIKFYTNLTGEQSDIPPTFFLTYRYHLKKGNIRAGIGGGVRNSKSTIPLNNGMTTAMHYDYQNVTGRIGYELFQNIAKRWQVFYGLDLRGSYTQSKADNYFDQMSGSIEGNTGYIYTASVAPVLGFRFKLNKRMSILRSELTGAVPGHEGAQLFKGNPGIEYTRKNNRAYFKVFILANKFYFPGFRILHDRSVAFQR